MRETTVVFQEIDSITAILSIPLSSGSGAQRTAIQYLQLLQVLLFIVVKSCQSNCNVWIYFSEMENLKNKERGVCCHICFVISILTNLCNILIQPGNLSEAIFKSLIHLFNTLTLLTKHFSMRSTKVNHAFENARYGASHNVFLLSLI